MQQTWRTSHESTPTDYFIHPFSTTLSYKRLPRCPSQITSLYIHLELSIQFWYYYNKTLHTGWSWKLLFQLCAEPCLRYISESSAELFSKLELTESRRLKWVVWWRAPGKSQSHRLPADSYKWRMRYVLTGWHLWVHVVEAGDISDGFFELSRNSTPVLVLTESVSAVSKNYFHTFMSSQKEENITKTAVTNKHSLITKWSTVSVRCTDTYCTFQKGSINKLLIFNQGSRCTASMDPGASPLKQSRVGGQMASAGLWDKLL